METEGKSVRYDNELEIITVLTRSYSRTLGGFRSVGRSPGLRDSDDWVVSILPVH